MKSEYRYRMNHTVIYSETDARGLLSLPSFFALFQEAALLHAERLGFGETYCEREGRLWVLSRLLLEIDSLPSHREEILLETWPKRPQGPFANRDFQLIGSDGQIHARATSMWLLLDSSTMRPVRPQSVFADFPFDELGEVIAGTAPKVSADGEGRESELNVTVRYSDLDQNNHVNNTRYVRWFLDCYTPEEILNTRSFKFLISYQRAAEFNDSIRLLRHDWSGSSTVRGYFEDGSESFAARIWLED